jgi:hypothetical protein
MKVVINPTPKEMFDILSDSSSTSNSLNLEPIFSCIVKEIDYQNVKWGYGPEHQHSLIEWLVIIERLVEKAKEEWYNGFESEEAIAGLRKIAATAIQGMNICGYKDREK